MTLSPVMRKVALVAHVVSSLGWLGSVATFLAIALVGLRAADQLTVRAAYVAMDLTCRLVVVPLCWATLVTGLVQSLGTAWGLFRHYWVLAKLGIAVVSTAILLLHLQPIAYLGRLAASGSLAHGDERRLRVQVAVDAGIAILALVVATVLSIFKPRGATPYGWRALRAQRDAMQE